MKLKYKLLSTCTLFLLFFIVFIFQFQFANCADSLKTKNSLQIDTSSKINQKTNLQIDTGSKIILNAPPVLDSTIKIDSVNALIIKEKTLTNTKLFLYILLSVGGLALFFYIFVLTLFRTFHKTRSTRQSAMLSWNLFFVLSVIWLFIVWGIIAGFWAISSFVILMIFLFIISLITLLIALKSK